MDRKLLEKKYKNHIDALNCVHVARSNCLVTVTDGTYEGSVMINVKENPKLREALGFLQSCFRLLEKIANESISENTGSKLPVPDVAVAVEKESG